MRTGTILERLGLWLCFGLWFLLVSGWAVGAEVWERTTDDRFDVTYRRADTDVSAYQQVVLDPLSVWYAEQEGNEDLERNVAALQSHFALVFSATLERYGFRLVTTPGAAVLRLHVELVDMRVNGHTSAQLAWSQRFGFQVTPGHMTLVAEVRDTSSGEVLLRIADRDDAEEGGDTWPLVDQIFASWASDIALTLQEPPAADLLARR